MIIFAACFVLVAGGIRWFQWKRKTVLSSQQAIIQLNSLDFETFCHIVVQRFSFMGYTIVAQSYDERCLSCLVKLIKNGDMMLMMIRRDNEIRMKHIQDLMDLNFTEGIDHGIFVSTGTYRPLAAYVSKRSFIELVDGKNLMIFLGKHIDDKCLLTESLHGGTSGVCNVISWIDSHKPICPHCQSPLIMKLSRSNGQPGKSFWKCIFHPQCPGMFDYEIDHPDIKRNVSDL